MISQPSRFAFVDEGEAVRILGVDRDTLMSFVHDKRLRAYKGGGTGNYYRTRDLEALLAELHTADDAPQTTTAEGGAAPTGRKLFDPAYKVHVRLQADLKWYDLEDDDLQAWAREMTPDGYTRQRTNIQRVVEKLQRMIQLMDERAAGWQHLKPESIPQPPATATPAPPATPPKRARTPLPMAGAPGPGASAAPSTPPVSPAAPPAKKVRKPLPMANNLPTGPRQPE